MIPALFRGWRGRVPAALVVAALAAAPAMAAEFALAPGQNVVGDLGNHVVAAGDVFADIARHADVGYTTLVTANPGVDPWQPGVGSRLRVPALHILPDAPHRGIVLNLGQYLLFYYPPGGGRVLAYPIGIGVIGWKTPFGATRVARKAANPVWYPPPSIRAQRPELPAVFPAGPDNPLGAFALYLGWKNYLIHGTNKPDGVGRNVSHGCIHLYPEDIEQLFSLVPVGTPVLVVNQPATAGWLGDRLYLEVYPSQSQTEEIDTERRVTPEPLEDVRPLVRAAAGRYADAVDWDAVDRAANERTGLPVLVAKGSALVGDAAPPDDGERAQRLGRNTAPPFRQPAARPFDRLLDELTERDAMSYRDAAPADDHDTASSDDPDMAQPDGFGTAESYGIAPGGTYNRDPEQPFDRRYGR